jgi:hypothetical protein
MAQPFSLSMGFISYGYLEVLADSTKGRQPGDRFLLREIPLIDPNTNQQVGRLIARVTYMLVSSTGDPLLYFGNADHHLEGTREKGVISLQGSWLETESDPVFPIIGGTGDHERARGTVTYHRASSRFTYDVL